MAIKLSEVNGVSNSTNLKYVADEESEKNNIPAEDKIQGTEDLVIESGKTYRMNSSGEWVQKSGSGGGGGGSDLPSVTAEDNGDVLTVVNGAWDKATPTTELPSISQGDNGKVLTVVNGAWGKTSFKPTVHTYTVTYADGSSGVIYNLEDE